MSKAPIGQTARMPERARGVSASVRIIVCAVIGVFAGFVVAAFGIWWLVPLAVWDIAAVVFLAWIWWSVWAVDAAGTARHALRDDPRRGASDGLLLAGSLASLLAVGIILVRASHSSGATKDLLIGASIISILLAWSVVHTVFCLRYARLYYEGVPGGIGFNENDPPSYADFGYVSLTIGMTFQVSDTDLQAKAIRHTATRHALLSYMFGTLIIATTINLVASLAK
ncbi:DUF1345 domain-containing protein [Baekduia soli]|nr:DUF1345 domain-containing protein [Baekduia soli]